MQLNDLEDLVVNRRIKMPNREGNLRSRYSDSVSDPGVDVIVTIWRLLYNRLS